MDAENMRKADWAIVEELRKGRNNAPNLAEETGYSAQYIRERLGRLKEDDVVVAFGHGIYELNPREVPNREGKSNE
jgi:DNA-binding Lrp family transcriptional regulator